MSKQGGRRYRDMVLSVGGSQPEMKTLVDPLGPPAQSHFLQGSGVSCQGISGKANIPFREHG